MERKTALECQSAGFPGADGGRSYLPSLQYADAPAPSRDPNSQTRLSAIVCDAIAPRLRLLHNGIYCEASASTNIRACEIAEFAGLTMLADNEAAVDYFHAMLARNHSVEALFVHLLAPAAHCLAELLSEDLCDVIDFTMGVARLRQFLLVFGEAEEPAFGEASHRALLICENDEPHIFDRDLVTVLLRGAGWRTSAQTSWCVKAAENSVAREWFGILNLTLDKSSDLEGAAAIINGVRRASCNEFIRVMASGTLFAGNPGLAAQIGADAAAADELSAVLLAKKLLPSRSMPK